MAHRGVGACGGRGFLNWVSESAGQAALRTVLAQRALRFKTQFPYIFIQIISRFCFSQAYDNEPITANELEAMSSNVSSSNASSSNE